MILVFNILPSKNIYEHGFTSIQPGSRRMHQCQLGPSVATFMKFISFFSENQNVDIDRGSCCLSASSSTVSMPVCRICQLPGMEPSNPLISPCRCLGSIRYVHNNCLLVSYLFQKFGEMTTLFQNSRFSCDFTEKSVGLFHFGIKKILQNVNKVFIAHCEKAMMIK